MDENLNQKQKEAVNHGKGPLLIAAGAGSGKTRTLVSRLCYLLKNGANPQNILAITFTNKAANEMKKRITSSTNTKSTTNERIHKFEKGSLFADGPFIGTFHSFGVKILKNESLYFKRTKNFTIFDDEDSLALVKKIIKEKNLSKEQFNPYVILSKISYVKNELLNIEELIEENPNNKNLAFFKIYEKELEKNNAFDFDDLIEKPVRLFLNDPQKLKRYQDRLEYILIDEYQDINTAQYVLVKLLAQKHKNLFVIGDDAQSIYGFRGSDFRNFLNFESDWPEAKIVKLEENYRSSANIINASSSLIKNNIMQKPKDLWTKNEPGELIEIIAFENAEEEGWGISEIVLELIRKGETPEEIAVLYRTNAQSRAIEQAFIQNSISYEIFGGLKFFARKEIKDLVAGLRYAFNPNDLISLERIEKNFSKAKSKFLAESLPQMSEKLSLVELINFFIENTNYLEYLENNFKNHQERLENVKELINFAASYQNPLEFLENISLMSSSDGKPKMLKNAVKLMTVHMAKGLEFNNVFVVGCNEKLLPHKQSLIKPEELEEERRLMYVAMTRARNKLHLSFWDFPSRFLSELPPELIKFKKASGYGFKDAEWDDETIYLE